MLSRVSQTRSRIPSSQAKKAQSQSSRATRRDNETEMDKRERASRQLSGPFRCLRSERLLLFLLDESQLGATPRRQHDSGRHRRVGGECLWGLPQRHAGHNYYCTRPVTSRASAMLEIMQARDFVACLVFCYSTMTIYVNQSDH